MDSKQAPPPAYFEAVSGPNQGNQNEGYVAPPGDQGSNTTAPAYPSQAGYPAGYSNPTGAGYGQPAPGGYGQQAPPAQGYYPPSQGYAGYGFNQQTAVVVNQPVSGTGMVTQAVPDHMGLAIFTTLCCCWPLGLVAIMRASESRRALERGDLRAASTYSMEARRYSMWAIAGGCISIVLTIVIIVVYVNSSVYY